MFVTEFKNTLCTLPNHEVGYEAFMERVERDHTIQSACSEFFVRITNYALSKTPPKEDAPVHYDPRLFLTAFAISRFPIEILGSPEEPLRFTLLNKAIAFLGEIDVVMYVLNPAEDDAADDFLDIETSGEYLHALNEFHSAWVATMN